MATRESGGNPVVAGASARLALRQQNLAVLLPVLLHDVNGALNGVTLSTELLARLSGASSGGDAATSATTLLQRARSELGRLKQTLKQMEQRLLPSSTGPSFARAAELAPTLREALDVLLPAVRRCQHEVKLVPSHDARPDGTGQRLALRADDLFDLVAGLLIVAIEGAAPHSTLEVSVEDQGPHSQLCIQHGGMAQAGIALEIHRELVRLAAQQAGGNAEWHQSDSGVRSRLRLPRGTA